MPLRYFSLALLLVVSLTVFPQTSQQAKAHDLINKANGLLGNGNAKESASTYEEALSLEPDNETALYNLGMAYFKTADYGKAAESWQKLKSLEPDDWRLRSKLIQVYQALGQINRRDLEHRELLELRKKGNSPELAQATEFCREQTSIAGHNVMVFEQFEMKGDRAIRYAFIVLDNANKEDFHLSLGSYDLTNSIWARENPKLAEKGTRLFHLDGYYKWGHATYGMYVGEPPYDDIRKDVVAVLEGNLKPASTTVLGKGEPSRK